MGVPVKRKFENEVEKPTNIPAQARPKSSAIAAPTLQKNFLSTQKSVSALHQSTPVSLDAINVEMSEDGAAGSETTLNSDRSHR